MNIEVDHYIENLGRWKIELSKLRELILDCGLIEEFKWKHPCYSDKSKNILLIHEFKNYCAILFHKGSLLKDESNILIQQTENSQSARQIRFKNISEILHLESTIKQYVFEAIEVERAGLKVKKKELTDYDLPVELEMKFDENDQFKIAFNSLTPGRQKGYLLHFSQPKQSKTKLSRIEKNIQRILDGYGLTDCTCGLSKRKPNCDGSHKQLEK